MKRALISIIAGAGLLVAPVASIAASTPLAPGHAAGVKQAENIAGMPVYALVGGVLVVVGIVAVASGQGGSGHIGTVTTCGSPSSPTTTCTSNTTATGTN